MIDVVKMLLPELVDIADHKIAGHFIEHVLRFFRFVEFGAERREQLALEEDLLLEARDRFFNDFLL